MEKYGTESRGCWLQRWVVICSLPPHSGPCQTLCARAWALDERTVQSKAEESWRWWTAHHDAWMSQQALVSEGCPVEHTFSEYSVNLTQGWVVLMFKAYCKGNILISSSLVKFSLYFWMYLMNKLLKNEEGFSSRRNWVIRTSGKSYLFCQAPLFLRV